MRIHIRIQYSLQKLDSGGCIMFYSVSGRVSNKEVPKIALFVALIAIATSLQSA